MGIVAPGKLTHTRLWASSQGPSSRTRDAVLCDLQRRQGREGKGSTAKGPEGVFWAVNPSYSWGGVTQLPAPSLAHNDTENGDVYGGGNGCFQGCRVRS